jgi:diaminopimelate epimerase
MEIKFNKYQGTGNDFVLLDNRNGQYNSLGQAEVKKICDRHFGIGADGLMLLNEKKGYDFEMIYYNSDGRTSTMCGNGGRCMIKFAHQLGLKKDQYKFLAVDGPHEAEMDPVDGIISLKMVDVDVLIPYHNDYILDTGSPHYVKVVSDLEHLDVLRKGREIRYNKDFEKEGINVNFVQQLSEEDKIRVRTYERGVENETLSCGTGVTAAALVCYHNENGYNEVEVYTLGGKLTVEFDRVNEKFMNVWLCGPAERVFDGLFKI